MLSIFKIISGVPWWVWTVFALLVFRGIQATKPNQTSIFVMPTVAIALSMYFAYKLVNFDQFLTTSLILSHIWLPIFLGMMLGLVFISKPPLAIDREKMFITQAGSYWFLSLFMTIFATKFFFGFLHATNPVLAAQLASIEILAFPGFILGIFYGRTINLLKYYFQAK